MHGNRAAAFGVLKNMIDRGQAADVIGLPAFLPSPDRQQANLDFIQANPSSFSWARPRKTFAAALQENGLQPQPAYDTYFDTLEQAFTDRSLFLPSGLEGTPLQPLLKLFYYYEDGLHHTIVYVRPTRDLWSRQQADQFRENIEGLLYKVDIDSDQYTLTGAHLLSAELKTVILKNMRSALLLAAVAIIVLLVLYYRSVFVVIGALAPLAAALTILSRNHGAAGHRLQFREHYRAADDRRHRHRRRGASDQLLQIPWLPVQPWSHGSNGEGGRDHDAHHHGRLWLAVFFALPGTAQHGICGRYRGRRLPVDIFVPLARAAFHHKPGQVRRRKSRRLSIKLECLVPEWLTCANACPVR